MLKALLKKLRPQSKQKTKVTLSISKPRLVRETIATPKAKPIAPHILETGRASSNLWWPGIAREPISELDNKN